MRACDNYAVVIRTRGIVAGMRKRYSACMQRTWDRARVITVLAALKDAGVSAQRMSRLAGVNRSTIYRWISGDVAPDYAPVRNLARGIWRERPDDARELVEASGWPWQEPSEQDLPPPPRLSEATKAAMRRELGDEMASALIAHHEHLASGRTAPAEDAGPPGSGGTGRRTAG